MAVRELCYTWAKAAAAAVEAGMQGRPGGALQNMDRSQVD